MYIRWGGLYSASPLGLPADDPGNKKAAPDGAVFDEFCAGVGSNRLGRMQRPDPLGAETNAARTSSVCSANCGEPVISTFMSLSLIGLATVR